MAKTKSTVTVELSDDDVKQAVIEWLETHHDGVGWTVAVSTSMTTVGFGLNETQTPTCNIKATRDL